MYKKVFASILVSDVLALSLEIVNLYRCFKGNISGFDSMVATGLLITILLNNVSLRKLTEKLHEYEPRTVNKCK